MKVRIHIIENCSKRVLGLQSNGLGRRHTLVTSFLLCFGGGVLLATTMIHLLPEINHSLSDSAEKLGLEFLPELVVCSGFFLIYLVEEMAGLVVDGYGSERRAECCHSDMERTDLHRGSAILAFLLRQ